MRRILILGVNSFTGHHLKRFIGERGLAGEYTVIGVDRQARDSMLPGGRSRIGEIGGLFGSGSGFIQTYQGGSCNNNIEYIRANLMDRGELERLMVRTAPDYIINLVGTFSSHAFIDYFRVNAELTEMIFEIILERGMKVRNILLVGSAAEYGAAGELPVKEDAELRPVGLYGLSKVMQWEIARYYHRKHGIPVNVARTFNIIGSGISSSLSVGSFIEQIRNAGDWSTIKVGNLEARRDYLHIDDVVEAYWEILMKGNPGETYNVCSEKSVSMEELLHGLIRQSGKSIYVVVDPQRLKGNDIKDIYGSNEKLREHIGWQPKKRVMECLDLFD